MSRTTSDNLVAQSIIYYDTNMNYIAPEIRLYFISSKHRHPAKLVQKMLSLVPQEEKYDVLYNLIANKLYDACYKDSILALRENFWLPVGDDILPQIGELDTPWKQQMIDYWLGKLDYTAA
jgi:hypothetical protein